MTSIGRGELALGRSDESGAVVEDDGSVVFRMAASAFWFQLHPGIVVDAQEQANELRIELVNGGVIVTETLSTRGGSRGPRLQFPPTRKELRKAKGREARKRARYEARERARRGALDRAR